MDVKGARWIFLFFGGVMGENSSLKEAGLDIRCFLTRTAMMSIKSGHSLVFGGPDFEPDAFISGSSLASVIDQVVRRGGLLANGVIADWSGIEFFDVRDGTYLLDAFTEAYWFLQNERDEFLRQSRFPGVDTRIRNFFGDADSCSMLIEPIQLTFLHELALELTISPRSQS